MVKVKQTLKCKFPYVQALIHCSDASTHSKIFSFYKSDEKSPSWNKIIEECKQSYTNVLHILFVAEDSDCGSVLRYNNHCDKELYWVGATEGFNA